MLYSFTTIQTNTVFFRLIIFVLSSWRRWCCNTIKFRGSMQSPLAVSSLSYCYIIWNSIVGSEAMLCTWIKVIESCTHCQFHSSISVCLDPKARNNQESWRQTKMQYMTRVLCWAVLHNVLLIVIFLCI